MALAVVAAVAAEAAWLAGRALEEDRFAAATSAALRSPEGQDALAARLQDVARAQTGRELPRAELDATVRAATRDPRVEPVLAAVAAGAREGLVRGGDGELELAPLRPALVAAAERVDLQGSGGDSGLAARVPPPEALGAIALPDLAPVPLLRAAVLDELPRAAVLIALAAAALVTLALMASPRRAGTARAAGWALVLAAALPPLARLVGPLVADRLASGSALGPFAGRLTAELLADWWIPAAVCAGAGLLLVAGGLALSPGAAGGRPARRRAG